MNKFFLRMHASSSMSSCSPSHISCAGGERSSSDFFLLLESEMAKNTLSFKQEIERISGGNYRLGKEDPLKRELENTVNSLRNQLAVLETGLAEANEEICVLREEKVSALSREKDQMEEFEAERDRLHRVIQRLSDENKDLSKQVKEITSQRNDLETKNRLEDKYRRALVYIDALQSKLSATPTPPRGMANRRPPPFFR